MSQLQLVIDEGPRAAVLEQLQRSLEQGAAAALVSPQERGAVEPALAAALPADLAEAAVVLGSGGSSGARRWCLQPLSHLEGAAQATAHWLEAQGISPQRCELFNPLPPHHISGLMPWIRSRCWGSSLRWLAPELMRDPAALAVQEPPSEGRSALLSLVPTQLERLLEHPAGRDWLQGFALIWVGGAALSASQAQRCRQWGIRLSPCYGSTETGAMVAALAPEVPAGCSGLRRAPVPCPVAAGSPDLGPAGAQRQLGQGHLACGPLAASPPRAGLVEQRRSRRLDARRTAGLGPPRWRHPERR